jgi:hypothetical protein
MGVSVSGIFGNVNCQKEKSDYHHGSKHAREHYFLYSGGREYLDFSEFLRCLRLLMPGIARFWNTCIRQRVGMFKPFATCLVSPETRFDSGSDGWSRLALWRPSYKGSFEGDLDICTM